jgi:hypothetical protein
VTLSSPSAAGIQAFTTATPVITGTAVPGNQGGTGVISSVSVVVTSSAGNPGTTFDLAPQAPTSGSTWTFSGSPLMPLAYNGQYSVTVTVTETDKPLLGQATTGTASTSVGFAENVAPAAPQGVFAKATGARQVTVSWSPNQEPDILSYVVLRSTGGVPPSVLYYPSRTATSYVDDTPHIGVSYTYAVEALRAGDTPGTSLLSPPSDAGTVEVSGSPPTGSGSTGSGSTGSGSTKAGSTGSGSTKAGSTGSGSTKAGSGSGAGQPATSIGPSVPLLTQSALAAQYQADIAAAGNAKAPSSATATTTSSKASGSSGTGAPTAGGFSESLPYPKGHAVGGVQAASDPTSSIGASGSRVRMLATVALGMILLVVAALAIRLVLKVRRG